MKEKNITKIVVLHVVVLIGKLAQMILQYATNVAIDGLPMKRIGNFSIQCSLDMSVF